MNLVPTGSTIIAATTLAAVILTGAPPSASATPAPAQDQVLQVFDITGGASAPAGPSFAAPRSFSAGVTPRGTGPFSLVGVTWTDPRATLDRVVEVRTRPVADGRWTAWQALDSDGPSPAGAHGRGRTDPLWVGASDAVEARVTADARALPAGLRLDLINPDIRTESAAAPTVLPRPMPRMITRAGWRADDRILRDPPEYSTDVQVMFVHHTAGTNTYNCADSAKIVRAIQGYHVRSNDWNDIGYNFLVDKCGNLFEGRKGGVNRAVLGAHTLGFNSHSSAIAVLGNYTAKTIPPLVRNVIAQVTAYKLGTYGNLATGRTTLESGGSPRFPKGKLVSLLRVSGHRDAGQTTCPGNALYSQLAAIRTVAGAGPAGLRLVTMFGATKVGSVYRSTGLVSPLWTTTTPSALMNRFDVLVDGKLVASVRNSHRRAAVRMKPGRHQVRVQAVHLSGRSASLNMTVLVR